MEQQAEGSMRLMASFTATCVGPLTKRAGRTGVGLAATAIATRRMEMMTQRRAA
jgi:hypothetical protein